MPTYHFVRNIILSLLFLTLLPCNFNLFITISSHSVGNESAPSVAFSTVITTEKLTAALAMSEPNPAIPLTISISDPTTHDRNGSPVVTLKVTIENTSDRPLLFLRWNSPFDTKAAPMGIFKFTSLKTGNLAPCHDLKLNRKPPRSGIFSPEDTIRIGPGSKVEESVEVAAPGVKLESGETYSVKAEGHWVHVRLGEHSELLVGDKENLRGEFQSEAVEVIVPA